MYNLTQSTSLNQDQRSKLEKIAGYEAPFLEEKLLLEGSLSSPEIYPVAFDEFKKYAFLATETDQPLGMSSRDVDQVWHQLILFTKEYDKFCKEYLGEFLHHVPTTSQTPVEGNPVLTFANMYKEVFGDVPTIWNLKNNWCSSGGCGSGQCGSGCGNDCSSCGSDGND